jgi:predicted transcriptional regulator
MKDRIKKFIDYKGISAGELADLLEVQRSNISHILNGRNKPGAVFIERFLLSFPEINARWLLTGKGTMMNESTTEHSTGNSSTLPDDHEVDSAEPPVYQQNNAVEKIILLHFDGTFSSYKPK